MWPFTRKTNSADVIDVLNLHRHSRVNSEQDDNKNPIAFKQKICDAAIGAIDRSDHPVGGYFEKVTLPSKKEITLSDSDKDRINAKMADAAKNTTIAAKIADFKAEVVAANEVVKADQSRNRFAAENYRDLLFNHKTVLIKELENQYKEELIELKKLETDIKFQPSLSAAAERTALVDAMVATLETKHKEELEKFNKKLDEELKRLMDLQTADISRLAFLGIIAKTDKNIEKRKKTLPAPQGGIGYSASATNATLFGIDPKEIKTFETASGKTVRQEGDTFMVESSRIGRRITKEDLLACALGVKAVLDAKKPPIPQKEQTLNASVQHDSPEAAKKLGKKAFEAALEAGFSADKISVTVNGETYTLNGKEKNAASLGVNVNLNAMTSGYRDDEGNRKFREEVKQLKAVKNAPPATAGTTVSGTPATGTTVSGTPPTAGGTSITGSNSVAGSGAASSLTVAIDHHNP